MQLFREKSKPIYQIAFDTDPETDFLESIVALNCIGSFLQRTSKDELVPKQNKVIFAVEQQIRHARDEATVEGWTGTNFIPLQKPELGVLGAILRSYSESTQEELASMYGSFNYDNARKRAKEGFLAGYMYELIENYAPETVIAVKQKKGPGFGT